MAKAGRSNLYESLVKPRFDEIVKWGKNGATERQIAKNLGIAYSTFNDYKSKHPELTELIKNARPEIVEELRSALIRKAMGYEYEEKKVVTTRVELPDEMRAILLDAGMDVKTLEEAKLIRTEITTKREPEDVAAINLALKNYDKQNWSNDPQSLELKKRELALKEKAYEDGNW